MSSITKILIGVGMGIFTALWLYVPIVEVLSAFNIMLPVLSVLRISFAIVCSIVFILGYVKIINLLIDFDESDLDE